MPQSLAHVLLHIVFSTKNREPLINDNFKHELYQYMGGICKQLECPAITIGGTSDHVHIALSLSRKISISKLVEELKRSSSKWAKQDLCPQFYWQSGYAVFSVSESQKQHVISYINEQEQHHQKHDFKSELLALLERHQTSYDSSHLWD